MTEKQFMCRVSRIIRDVTNAMKGEKSESVNTWCGKRVPHVFAYAATSEACMERQLAVLKGCERKTTFMSDFSIGEWCEGFAGVLDTLKRSIVAYRNNAEYVAELVLCVNWKAWEHNARGNSAWSKFYSILYEQVLDLVYDYYANDKQKTQVVWEYLD